MFSLFSSSQVFGVERTACMNVLHVQSHFSFVSDSTVYLISDNVIGTVLDQETDQHEYKSLMVTAEELPKSKKPRSADKSKNQTMHYCSDASEVLKKVVKYSKGINAMLNHRNGGIVHFGISDNCMVEEGLDLNQTEVIDELRIRVGQLLQDTFFPTVQTDYVEIKPVNLLDSSNQSTGRWRFDIVVHPFERNVFCSRESGEAYYRQ